MCLARVRGVPLAGEASCLSDLRGVYQASNSVSMFDSAL